MNKTFSIVKKEYILPFFALLFIVPVIHFSLLTPQLQYGLSPDDISFLSDFKLLGDNPYSKIKYTWENFGPHFTPAIYYIGTLYTLFGFNYHSYYLLAQILKIISVLTLYPLILIITKKPLLASIATILYTIHYSPVGSLEMIVRTNDFLALSIMNIFLFLYYYIIEKGKYSFKWLIFISILLFLSFSANLIRIFPILVFILLTETLLFVKVHFFIKRGPYFSFKRVLIILAPYILISLVYPKLILSEILQAQDIIQKVALGNWQLLLNPLASLGSMFFMENHWIILGTPIIKDLQSYLIYLSGFMMFLIVPILIIALATSKSYKRFILRTLLANLLGDILIFIILVHWKSIDQSHRLEFNPNLILPHIIFGNFILSLIFSLWREWINGGMKDKLLLISWLSIIFSFIFIIMTWFFAFDFIGIKGYLTIPAMGIAVFIATIIYDTYEYLRRRFKYALIIAALVPLLIIPLLYIASNQLIQQYLNGYLINGMSADDQKIMRDKLKKHLEHFSHQEPSLFFFDGRGDYKNGTFYATIMLNEFPHWMQVYDPLINNICNMPRLILNDEKKLSEITTLRDGKLGFIYQSYCNGENFYSLENFYAFKLKDRDFIDIRSEIIQKLVFP